MPGKLEYDKALGYYAVDLCETGIPIRLIALNSAKSDEWGADGRITTTQREWMKTALQSTTGGINLVFAHHRPQEFDAETQALLSAQGHGTVVMFTGHTHQHSLMRHASADRPGYYELNTGSVLEFPQIGRVIELRGTPSGPVWLVSRALWSTFMAVREMPLDSEIEKTLAECRENRDDKRKDMGEAVRCGHYAAYGDYLKGRRHAWGRVQLFEEAWKEANVMIPIRP